MQDTLGILLAGGVGERLYPLTRQLAKPAVPFGGSYRIIDFTLSNCINSGLRKIHVLTQYKAMSLDRHINIGWRRRNLRDSDSHHILNAIYKQTNIFIIAINNNHPAFSTHSGVA